MSGKHGPLRLGLGRNPSAKARLWLPILRSSLAEGLEPGEEQEVDRSDRPKSRVECKDGPRPCPWTSCRHHLYLDVDPSSGMMTLNFPGAEVDQLPETCSLDLAERGPLTLDEVGSHFNVTRERVRQIEVHALARMRGRMSRLLGED